MMITLLFMALSPVPGAGAQEWTPELEARLSASFRRCSTTGEASEGVHPAMMRCESSEYVRQDARLNAAYRATRIRLSGAERARLRDEQRQWISHRDATCQAVFDQAGGGQASELNQSGCLLRETIARTIELERQR